MSSRRALHVTTGSSVGTNVSPGTARLTVRATILTATAGPTPGTHITLATVGVQDTGRLTVGTLATGRRATGIGKMGMIMVVITRGANPRWLEFESPGYNGWCQENERHNDHDESQWFTHAVFLALSVDQLINSLHR